MAKLTRLKRIDKALSQINQAFKLIQPEHMAAEYVDTARAQLAVAYKNLSDHRRWVLNGAPRPENQIGLLGAYLTSLNSVPARVRAERPINVEIEQIESERAGHEL